MTVGAKHNEMASLHAFPGAVVTLQKPGATVKSQSPQVILHTCVQQTAIIHALNHVSSNNPRTQPCLFCIVELWDKHNDHDYLYLVSAKLGVAN